MDKTARTADLLLAARRDRVPLDGLPAALAPDDMAAAYAVQDVHVAGLIAAGGGAPIGYKIGCSNEAVQAMLNLDAPIHGRLLSGAAHGSPAVLRADAFFVRLIEVEFAFQMADDLPPAAAPYDPDGVAAAVGLLIPAIEIVDSRYRDWTQAGALALVADNGETGAWVRGQPIADWHGLDLGGHPVSLTVNGDRVRDGVGAKVLGHPLNALTWIANALCLAGGGLRAGDLVSTGTCTEIYSAEAGDRLTADFGALGRVSLEFEAP